MLLPRLMNETTLKKEKKRRKKNEGVKYSIPHQGFRPNLPLSVRSFFLIIKKEREEVGSNIHNINTYTRGPYVFFVYIVSCLI